MSSLGIYNETYFQKNPEQANLPGILYCVVLVDKETNERVCLKIGITKGKNKTDVFKRFNGFKGYEARVQKLVYGTLEEVYYLEQYLHEMWDHKRWTSPWKFGGHRELFEIDTDIIRSIPDKV